MFIMLYNKLTPLALEKSLKLGLYFFPFLRPPKNDISAEGET